MTTMRLTKDVWCTGIHGVTGQPTEEGTLEAGALVRNLELGEPDVDGGTLTTFEASTDSGRSWYRQQTYAKVQTESV